MQPVLNFAALTASLKAKGRRWRVAVVCGTDRATLEALMRGTAEGFIEPWLFIPENFNHISLAENLINILVQEGILQML